MPTDTNTALEKPAGVLSLVPARILTDNVEVTALCVKLTREGANIVGPKVTTLGQAQGFAFSAIQLNPSDDRECYCDPGAGMGPTERALTKNALDQIANLAGINWTPDCRVERLGENRVIYYAHGTYRDQVGETRTISGTREIDLRDAPIGKDSKGMSPKQLQRAQKYLIPMAESKAKNRAIRQALSLKNKYQATELARPFVVLRPVAMPDTRDPVVRQAVALHALGAKQLLYSQAPPTIDVEVEPETKDQPGQDEGELERRGQEVQQRGKGIGQPHGPELVDREPGEDDIPLGTGAPLGTGRPGGEPEGELYTIVNVFQVSKQWMASTKELEAGWVVATSDSGIAVSLKRCAMSDGKLRPRLIITKTSGSLLATIEEITEIVNTETGEVG